MIKSKINHLEICNVLQDQLCFLPLAKCLLSIVYCLLPIVYCLLPIFSLPCKRKPAKVPSYHKPFAAPAVLT